MAKRFTDTNKYRKPFIRGLKGAYKLLWDFLYHDCDHAGIWIVDFEIAQMYVGADMKINKEDALKNFNEDEIRIIELDNGKKWFIPSFIEFQYGRLNDKNKAHSGIIIILSKYNLIDDNLCLKGHISPIQGAMDKYKDKEMGKDKVKGEFNNFPIPTDFNGLPEIRRGSIHQLMKITKQIDLSDEQINGMWDVFKVQNLTGNKHYHTEDDVYSYFMNWIKDKKFDDGTHKQSIKHNPKSAGQYELLDRLKGKVNTGGK